MSIRRLYIWLNEIFYSKNCYISGKYNGLGTPEHQFSLVVILSIMYLNEYHVSNFIVYNRNAT